MSDRSEFRQWLDSVADDHDESPVLFEPENLDAAIIGLTYGPLRVVYSYEKIVQVYMSDGMTEEEAIEFVDYNTVRGCAYMGENAPVIVYTDMPEKPELEEPPRVDNDVP